VGDVSFGHNSFEAHGQPKSAGIPSLLLLLQLILTSSS